jgi:hypothetical protein
VEAVIFPGNEPSIAKLLDLEMMVLTGGQERTEAQHQALFQAAGLQLTKIMDNSSTKIVTLSSTDSKHLLGKYIFVSN